MSIELSATVRDLAVSIPGATKLFESFGIDYCCRGARTLEQACAEAHVKPGDMVSRLERASERASAPSDGARWGTESLGALVRHIVEHHHTYTREALDTLDGLSNKVLAAHGHKRPELARVRATFVAIADDLRPHLVKEEQILFPYIEELEAAVRAGRGRPFAPFGTIDNPVRMMMYEHDHVGDLLHEMRALTGDYAPPADACASYQALYAELRALEHDLFEHIHLESNLLFPRAIEMERR